MPPLIGFTCRPEVVSGPGGAGYVYAECGLAYLLRFAFLLGGSAFCFGWLGILIVKGSRLFQNKKPR